MSSIENRILLLKDASGVSLQDRVRDFILSEIESGAFVVDGRLPTEKEIAALLGVSTAPVRGAMDQLAQSGYVDRRQGKGTFVRDRRIQHAISAFGSLTDRLREYGLAFAVDVLKQGMELPPEGVDLELGKGETAFHLLRRIIIDGRVVASLDSWSKTAGLVQFYEAAPFNHGQSLYALFRAHGVEPVRANSSIEVSFCRDADAALMGVAFGTAMLQLISTATDGEDPLEWSRALYVADLFTINIGPDMA